MKKFAYLVMFGFAFTTFQTVTVEAETGGAVQKYQQPGSNSSGGAVQKYQQPGSNSSVAKTIDHPSCTVAPEMRAADCPPMSTGGGNDDGVALTIDDPKCVVAAAHRDPSCPNANMP